MTVMAERSKAIQRDDIARAPNPSHRHAAPSSPWPWMDLSDEVDQEQLFTESPAVPPLCNHIKCEGKCWKIYPRSRFPNWTHSQVKRSEMGTAINDYDKNKPCVLYYVDVNNEGHFSNAEGYTATKDNIQGTWDYIVKDERPTDLRVRTIFVENLSGPMLQMLGARFNIEPFFWSSSLNWIPSRYQEDPQIGKSDHITVTLTFLRSMPKNADALCMDAIRKRLDSGRVPFLNQMIDTQTPLILVLDLLSVHLIRGEGGSTMISYHPSLPLPTTTAKDLHQRIRFAGRSVYWQKMLQNSPDPTFVLLTCLWHAMYAWDEALEKLYAHICTLEAKVIETSEMDLTRELHIIRAHLLYYSSLLEDFRKTVLFIRETPNPALEQLDQNGKLATGKMLERECQMMTNEIQRLDSSREMQDRRLKNVMNLVFSSVNILDSRRMQQMTEAAVRDSAAMKQIAYLTMVFLPSSFVAAVFGMNVKEMESGAHETLARYIGTAIAMTVVTIWIIMAFQSRYMLPDDYGFFRRLGWPIFLLLKGLGWFKPGDDENDHGHTDTKDQQIGEDREI